ncbi:Ff.00g088820.m01.CDS01 [Fusarium sp. VM40]|nr:Ff.00g088820.m01.CDS01 [Fusarium sp. VM40]
MLPSSMRRVVSAVSSAPQTGIVSSFASTTPKTTPVFIRAHQRRCSSSKPSKSDSGSNEISAGQSVPAAATPKSGSEKRKRKSSKDTSDRSASVKKLPSVPNTHHMSQEALGLSSFFSLHRPISVTQTMPRAVTDEHFASIFAARTRNNKLAETESTLASTIEQLEGPMAQMTIGGEGHEGMHKVDIKNPDGTESSMYLQIDTMSGEFLPFRPPPLPQPEAAGEASSAVAEAEAAEDVPQHRVYKALFTIEESTDPDGQIRIMAHSPRIVQDAQPRSFLERLALRQLKFDEAQGRRDMHAISVKRQRKLKMKKKKYKKLMKRTRVLRRKLDRT